MILCNKNVSLYDTLIGARMLKLFTWLPLLLVTSGNSVYSTEEIITPNNWLMLKINVSTNVKCFTCEYETLFSKSYEILREGERTTFSHFIIIIPTDRINCDNPLMSNDLQLMLKSSQYPKISIEMDDLIIRNAGYNLVHTGALITLLDISKRYTIPISAVIQNDQLHLQGCLKIQLSDFDISPPTKLFGFVKVNNTIDIQFGLIYTNYAKQRALKEIHLK